MSASLSLGVGINQVVGDSVTAIPRPRGALGVIHLNVEVGDFRLRSGGFAPFTFTDSDVNVANNTIAKTAHGLTTGYGPAYPSNSGGALPGGLTATTPYYFVVVDEDTLKLADSPTDAESGVAVDITSAAGGGTHTLGAVPAAADATQSNGNGSLLLTAGDYDINAPRGITVLGSAGGSILNYWWV